jgi:UDP-N-acetylmuramate dehydrogenase
MRISVASKEQTFKGHPSALRPHPWFGIAETNEFGQALEWVMRGDLRLNEPMARHTSWRAGGCADQVYLPADLDDLAAFLRVLPPNGAVLMVGLGSNLLVRDGGLRGTVIVTHWALREVRPGNTNATGGEICAQAGVPAPKVARLAALNDFAGAEFLAGIPGTMGGALAMNAGCYGGETWDIVARVRTIDRAGNIRSRTAADYEIGYRHVRLKEEGGRRKEEVDRTTPPLEEWFVSATLALPRGSGAESRAKITELLKRRIATQPLNQPNAGSVFRNPPGDYAARLIEACGLKGRSIGGARISAKHANFIVNAGGACAADIEALILLAEQSVREKFGVVLEREVRIVGERDEGGGLRAGGNP